MYLSYLDKLRKNKRLTNVTGKDFFRAINQGDAYTLALILDNNLIDSSRIVTGFRNAVNKIEPKYNIIRILSEDYNISSEELFRAVNNLINKYYRLPSSDKQKYIKIISVLLENPKIGPYRKEIIKVITEL